LSVFSYRFRYFEPSRLSGTVFCVWLGIACGALMSAPAWAQANNIEESGVAEKRADSPSIDDKAFDCGAFTQAIGAAGDGFKSLRGARKSDGDTIAIYGVALPLFGVCEILEKKKINEVSYSCQAGKLSLADIKATVEGCLGNKAFGLASNENPNTPYLRYAPQIGEVKARVIALTTFGKNTLVIFSPK
jgi:hypothetical protein